MKTNRKLNMITLEGNELIFQERDVVVTIANVPEEKAPFAEQIVLDFLDKYNEKVFYINGLSDAVVCDDALETDTFKIRFKDGQGLKKSTQNAFGSFDEFFQREIQLSLFNLLNQNNVCHDFSALDISISRPGASFMSNGIEFDFFCAFDGEPLKPHRASIEWRHNGYYSSTCSSCQSGVYNLMGGINYLKNRILLSKDKRARDGSKSWSIGDATFEVKNDKMCRFVQLKKTTTPQDLVEFFRDTFIGAIELAHVEKIILRVNGFKYEAEGTQD